MSNKPNIINTADIRGLSNFTNVFSALYHKKIYFKTAKEL